MRQGSAAPAAVPAEASAGLAASSAEACQGAKTARLMRTAKAAEARGERTGCMGSPLVSLAMGRETGAARAMPPSIAARLRAAAASPRG